MVNVIMIRITISGDTVRVCSRVRPIPCWRPLPNAIGRSCTDTDTGNDVSQLGHMYDSHNSSSARRADSDVVTTWQDAAASATLRR